METAFCHHHRHQDCVFPLTSLQIGDLQSYLSDLSLFLAFESKRFYILVDNRPWLNNLSSRSAWIWQLMVTKSRLSPFAKTKTQRKKTVEKQGSFRADSAKRKMFKKWFSLIDSANLSHKRVLFPVNNLRDQILLNSNLHGVLHGFIIFEVEWAHVRGINYFNELLTDTSFSLETKIMKRWEFDCIGQAVGCFSSWFSGTEAEAHILKDHLHNSVEEEFFDATEEFSSSDSLDLREDSFHGDPSGEDIPPSCLDQDVTAPLSCEDSETSIPSTPLALRRRKVTSSISIDVKANYSSEERHYESEDHNTCSNNGSESSTDSFMYKDMLIVFRFKDHDLPFKLKDIIVSNLRLLTLLEAGLPSWVIFLQSYPGLCHVYRPWMCPLARALYVSISIVTVLIGFYDLYKNVPVLKATAAHLCGPLLDWIDTWEMATCIQYLGTMLFLHNSKKAIKGFLTVSRTFRSFLSVLTQPLIEPLIYTFDFLIPLWNICSSGAVSLCSVLCDVIGSLWNLLEDLGEMLLQPLSSIWTVGTSVLFPPFQFLWEMFALPIRLIIFLADKVEDVFTFLLTSLCGSLISLWQTLSGMFRVASASTAVATAGGTSKWRVLWNDLFSHVFRAIRSILNGFIAFFLACNRHRLSIYNHIQVFIHRLAGQEPQINSSRQSPCRTPIGVRSGTTSPRRQEDVPRSSGYARPSEGSLTLRISRPVSPEILSEDISMKLQTRMV
ncbi:hypothetical protein MLD38_015767 [Melastoma candidum]|uniref:Uncharacterized protein n=1 Tax=Melastoma candidum TaxID=119954 RepID=A0ACB9RJ43_9MYRT|nr:hypothetical protein MLD38_015767 [Melastoma candidum]